MCFDSSTRLYNYQLDEQWFNLYKVILRDALDITSTKDNNPFGAPPSSDTVIEYVNTLGYPCTLRNVSAKTSYALDSLGKNLTTALHGKNKSSHLLNPSVRFIGKDGREIFGMSIPDALLTNAIKRAPYYSGYLEQVAEYQSYIDEEYNKEEQEEAVTESPNATKVTKKRMPKSPLQLVDEFINEGVPRKEPAYDDEEANLQWALELNLKEQEKQGLARPMVIRKPDSRIIQPLLDVQGKGKEKVIDEQGAHDLLTLQTSKKKSHTDQFFFQRHTPMPTKPSRHAESPSLDEEVPEINVVDQDEGQVGQNPGEHDEGQAGSTPGDVAESQPQSSHVVHTRPNLEHMDLEATDASTQQNPKTHGKFDSRQLSSRGKAMQAPLRAHFNDLPIVDLKEILQQRMFEDNSYKAYKAHENLFEALEKYSNQLLANMDEARWKKRKRQNTRKEWWKPLPEEERSATLEPAWTIPSSNMSNVEKNWATALSLTYATLVENSLLAKTGDITTFMNWYCHKVNKTVLTQADFEGQAYEVVKAFYPDVVHLQFQMEECHKLLTYQIDWANPGGEQVKIDVSRLMPLGGPPAYSRYGYDYLSEIVLRRADFQEHTIVEKYFKNLYPNDFEDLNLILLQGHLDHLPGFDKRYEFKHDYTIIESPRAVVFPVDNNKGKIMRFNEIYKFSNGTLTRILEALDYRVKEFKDTSSKSGNDADVDKPVYDEEPMTEVQLTAECNICTKRQQDNEQREIINEGRVVLDAEHCQVTSPLLDSSPDN
nr:hypothetical protein [Tanacetum cinerariifolium]